MDVGTYTVARGDIDFIGNDQHQAIVGQVLVTNARFEVGPAHVPWVTIKSVVVNTDLSTIIPFVDIQGSTATVRLGAWLHCDDVGPRTIFYTVTYGNGADLDQVTFAVAVHTAEPVLVNNFFGFHQFHVGQTFLEVFEVSFDNPNMEVTNQAFVDLVSPPMQGSVQVTDVQPGKLGFVRVEIVPLPADVGVHWIEILIVGQEAGSSGTGSWAQRGYLWIEIVPAP